MNVESELVFIVNAAERTRSLLRDCIAAERLHVVTCGSAAEYLSHPKRGRSACVLVDVHLPDMCGLALQRQIAVAAVPVIFVVNEADMTSSVRALKAGAADFLATPVCPTELVAAVHAAIERGRQARNMRARVAEVRERWTKLTPREREVMTLIVSGLLNKQVASELGISSVTVQIHRGRTMQKMAAESFADLVRMAHTLGIPDDHKRPTAASPAQRIHPSPSSGARREDDDDRALVKYRSAPLAAFTRDTIHPISIPSRAQSRVGRIMSAPRMNCTEAMNLARVSPESRSRSTRGLASASDATPAALTDACNGSGSRKVVTAPEFLASFDDRLAGDVGVCAADASTGHVHWRADRYG